MDDRLWRAGGLLVRGYCAESEFCHFVAKSIFGDTIRNSCACGELRRTEWDDLFGRSVANSAARVCGRSATLPTVNVRDDLSKCFARRTSARLEFERSRRRGQFQQEI